MAPAASSEVRVEVDPAYAVRVGAGALDGVPGLLGERPARAAVAVVTDGRVAALHGQRLAALGDCPWIQVPRGEDAKRFARLEVVLNDLAAGGLDRRSAVVTLGGGAVCDVGGLAASLFMRGIDVLHCPTTLLAQVDASVGGKTAVNLAAGKNLAGTFHQPIAVACDVDVLATLDDAELRSGLGEVVKTALLEQGALFELVEQSAEALLARDPAALAEVVTDCVRHKAAVVAADEREVGPRRSLNLGHTFAHAIEGAADYGAIPHGVAVGVGLMLALECSARSGLLEDPELPARLLERLGLPTGLAQLREVAGALPVERLEAFLATDKKGAGGEPRFVLPRSIGRVELDVPVEPALVRDLLG